MFIILYSLLLSMPTLESLQQEINALRSRNQVVETNKAWETSSTRKWLILWFTYVALALYMRAINLPQPRLNAVIPSVGFWLSTLTLPWFKKQWIKYTKKDK